MRRGRCADRGCFAEVSSRFSDTGGPYLYAREAFGPLVGFQIGWMMWIARLTAFAADGNLFVAYFAYFVPATAAGAGRAGLITLVVIVLTAVNLFRRRADAPEAHFRAPAGVAVSVVALVLVAWLSSNSTATQARDAAIATFAGVLLYWGSRRARPPARSAG